MPMTNAKIHTPARIKRKDFPIFHLSVKNNVAVIYTRERPDVIASPSIAKEVKSATSKRSNTPDQIAFGKYKITDANPAGSRHANATKSKSKEKTALINGTKIQFNNNAQPDTYPKYCNNSGAVKICAPRLVAKKELPAR